MIVLHFRCGLFTLTPFHSAAQHLRQVGVVGKFVEFFGPGVAQLSIADRATIANMCPEYGATAAFFPVDEVSIKYLVQTGEYDTASENLEPFVTFHRAQNWGIAFCFQPLKGTGSNLHMSFFSLWSHNNCWDISRCEVDRVQSSGRAQLLWKPRVEAVESEVRGWTGRD